jgi:uncharacterized protein YecE (DUF72 family)
VIVDEPPGFVSSIPWIGEVTTSWFGGACTGATPRGRKGLTSSGERFNYLYSAAELDELAEKVRTLAARAQRTHVYFNNNFEDYGVRNALDFGRLLGG